MGLYRIVRKETVDPIASSARIIEDVDWALEALEIVYSAHGAAIEVLTYWP